MFVSLPDEQAVKSSSRPRNGSVDTNFWSRRKLSVRVCFGRVTAIENASVLFGANVLNGAPHRKAAIHQGGDIDVTKPGALRLMNMMTANAARVVQKVLISSQCRLTMARRVA